MAGRFRLPNRVDLRPLIRDSGCVLFFKPENFAPSQVQYLRSFCGAAVAENRIVSCCCPAECARVVLFVGCQSCYEEDLSVWNMCHAIVLADLQRGFATGSRNVDPAPLVPHCWPAQGMGKPAKNAAFCSRHDRHSGKHCGCRT